MNKKLFFILIVLVGLTGTILLIYPDIFRSKPDRKVLYWTDPMIPGDKSDHPGKSPMGMERVPVYADDKTSASSQTSNETEEYYTCPMHPSVRKSSPGACPVCGMTLVKKTAQKELSHDEQDDPQTVTLSPSKQVLANIATTIATRKQLIKHIRAVGTINYAEPNFKHISTRFPGRLEKLYLTYTGQIISKGDPVADVYSPEAITAQQEYLLARDSYEQVKDANDMIASGASSLLEQSKQKLLRWGFTETQMTELESMKQVQQLITIHSPISGTVLKKNVDPQHYAAAGEDIYDIADLSTVWLTIDIYESQIGAVKIGQQAVATTEAYPNDQFIGAIKFISPTIEPSSRTVRVRVELPNPKLLLKPEMFVTAVINVTLPPAVTVPATALLSTGRRQVVWVQQSEGVFEPRAVQVGERSEEFVQIIEGLEEGEIVVSSGGYLLDSESQLETANNTIEHQHSSHQQ